MSRDTKKIYVPYDYRVMMRGYYEIIVPVEKYEITKRDIENGSFNVQLNGTKLTAEELFIFDEYIINKPISEENFENEDYLKSINTNRGFTVQGTKVK